MTVRNLRWVAIALPVVWVMFLHVTTGILDVDPFGVILGEVIFFLALALGAALFATLVFGWVDRSQQASEARAAELQALNELGNALAGPLTDEAIVARTLESASAVLPARAVGIALSRPGGRLWSAIGEQRDALAESATSHLDAGQHRAATLISGAGSGDGVLVASPLDAAGTLYALLDSEQAGALTSTRRLLDGLATHAAAALQRYRLLEDVRRSERAMRALYAVGIEIASSQDVTRVLQQVTADACRLVGGRAAALCLVNEHDGTLSLAQTAGDTTALGPFSLANPAVHAGSRVRIIGNSPPGCDLGATTPGALRSQLSFGNSILGELCVAPTDGAAFSDSDRELLGGLADMAAIAIHNSRLLDHERRVAVLEERDHIAREMHDTLAQVLGYLHLKAATTRKRLQSGDLERAGDELEEMQDLANEAYVDVREAILGLRETVAPAGGFIGGLRQYLQKFSRQSGVDVRLDLPPDAATSLAPEGEIQLLRVVQEALTNVRKHAAARNATVRIDNDGSHLRVTIEDDGRGFDAGRLEREEGRSYGMRSMRERVERAGGQLTVESAPGAGTRILVLLPLSDPGGGSHVAFEGTAR